MQSTRASHSQYNVLRGAAALFAITILSYLSALRGGFIWDDDAYVTANPNLHSFEGLVKTWADLSANPQYYPLVHTTFWIESHLWGTSFPLGFHLVNVLLHAASAVLLWRLLNRLAVPMPWAVAAIWAVHPVNVESVAWITERKNVLSGFFYLLAMGFYLQWIMDSGQLKMDAETPTPLASVPRPPLSIVHYPLSIICFLLALFSKTVAATFPAAILLVIWWKRGRLRWRDIVPLLPFFATGISMSCLTGYLERTHVGARGPEWSSLTALDRLLIACRALWFYAGKLLLPTRLTFIYPRWVIDRHDPWQYLYAVAAVIVVIGLFLLPRRWGRGPLVAVLFFGGTLVPALGFVNVYPMRYSFVADHFQYLASIGLIALFAGTLVKLLRDITARRLVIGAWIIVLMFTTFLRGQVYRDSETLWRDTMAKNPNSWMVHANLGHALRALKRYNEASQQYQQELALQPNLAEPHGDMGNDLARRGLYDQAIAQFQQAVQLNPGDVKAYAELAQIKLLQNQLTDAETAARQAVSVGPNYAFAHYMLGQVLERTNRIPDAAEQYIAAIEHDPSDARSHFHLGNCLQQLGQLPAALGQYQATVALDPTNAPAWTDLGWMYLTRGQTRQAAGCFQQALRIDPKLIPAHRGLQLANPG